MQESNPKGKAKKEEEATPPYIPQKMKMMTQCLFDASVIEQKGLCLFKGEFNTPKGKKVWMVSLLEAFQRFGQEEEYRRRIQS